MERVKSQAAVVSQLLFDPKTAGAYKDILTLTGKIIKEIALLVWLLICSVLVLGAWFSNTAIGTGRSAREWWQTQQTSDSVDGNQAAAATGQAFLDVSQNGANFLVDRAREQLGLEKLERPVKETAAAPVEPQTKTVAKKAPAPTAPATPKVEAVVKDVKAPAPEAKDVPQAKESSEPSVPEKS